MHWEDNECTKETLGKCLHDVLQGWDSSHFEGNSPTWHSSTTWILYRSLAPTYQFHCQKRLVDKISCIFLYLSCLKSYWKKQHYKKDENRNILAIQGKETEILNKTVLAVMAGSREGFDQSGYNTEKLYNCKWE